jgi:hypothetical protein
MTSEMALQDAFALLCGRLLGEGIHRRVYECRIRPDLVVKVESDELRYFANVHEHKFWADNQHRENVACWLAPCEYLSPDGRVSLQKRVEPITSSQDLPDALPAFLTDVKRSNFGWLDGRLVCVDYAMVSQSASARLRRVFWENSHG